MLGQNLSAGEQDQLADLLTLDRFRLKMVYWELPTPTMADVSGEYDAQLLDQGDRFGSFLTRRAFGSKGPWVGKAFRPLSHCDGEGYNAFGTVEDRKALLPMDTYIDYSNIVPGDSFILDYRSKNRGPIRWLRGELRQVSPNVLLGMGTFGPQARRLHKLRRVIPFVLARSDREYLGGERLRKSA
ncbi:hypothetical protein Enr13x_31290 [Stieleria neptunia]|uniref:Uncharacterized protein n=1 Tax=Stieleria neptunia TaxID=2527979 RepID=A0A518HR07_9BACT|nr:hypothetical protein [Stieleria neptunia]QDV43274.1 hypothetical protein Enr13x_31290 [Stieleria neptunia]